MGHTVWIREFRGDDGSDGGGLEENPSRKDGRKIDSVSIYVHDTLEELLSTVAGIPLDDIISNPDSISIPLYLPPGCSTLRGFLRKYNRTGSWGIAGYDNGGDKVVHMWVDVERHRKYHTLKREIVKLAVHEFSHISRMRGFWVYRMSKWVYIILNPLFRWLRSREEEKALRAEMDVNAAMMLANNIIDERKTRTSKDREDGEANGQNQIARG